MAEYYVDSAAGDDGAAGTSELAPWKSFDPKVNGETFSPDDIIHPIRGGEWRETFTVPSSGTSGHPITVEPYGTGADPIFSGADLVTGWVAAPPESPDTYFKAVVQDPIVLITDDVAGQPVASVALLSADKDFFYDSGTTSIWLKSTSDPAGRVIEQGSRTNCIDTNGQDYLDFTGLTCYGQRGHLNGGGINVNASTYIGITDCTLTRNGHAGLIGTGAGWGYITATNTDMSYNGFAGASSWTTGGHTTVGYCTFTGCNFFENGWEGTQAASGLIGMWPNCEIGYGSVYNNGNQGIPANESHNHGLYMGSNVAAAVGIYIHHMEVYGQQQGNGIKLSGSSGIVEYCYSHDNYYAGITAGYNNGQTVTASFRHNLCVNNGFGFWEQSHVSGTTNVELYHNTFYFNDNNAKIAYPYNISVINDITSLVMKNNIIVGNSSPVANHREIVIVAQSAMVADYNCVQYAKIVYGGANKTFAQWQAAGFDANGMQADPLFVNAGGTTEADYFRTKLSPCRNAGVVIAGINDGYSGSAPDMGAFEYTAVPDAATALGATAAGSSQIDLVWSAPLDTGDSAITGWLIERESPSGNGFATLVADTGDADVTYSDTGLAAGTEYNYRVSAINAVGTGPASNESAATTEAASNAGLGGGRGQGMRIGIRIGLS